MSYSIKEIGGLSEDEIQALKALGLRTTERLLEAARTPKGRRHLAEYCQPRQHDHFSGRIRPDPGCVAKLVNLTGVLDLSVSSSQKPSTVRRRDAS